MMCSNTLSGSTAQRVCLAGDSAGGNLCITVSMKAMSHGVRVPDGIMAAYPATLLTMDASPSRLLTLIDPVLPLSVLNRCINAYTGMIAKPTFLLFYLNDICIVSFMKYNANLK